MAEGRVRVRLYASARTAVGRSAVDVEVPPGGASTRAVVDLLRDRWPRLAPILRASRLLRNDEYLTDLAVRLRPGDELAVHPPYGGG